MSLDDELERATAAAREALARAKAGAAARGLRPGAPGRARRRRVAGEARELGAVRTTATPSRSAPAWSGWSPSAAGTWTSRSAG